MRLRLTFLAIFVLAGFCLTSGCTKNPATGRRQLLLMSSSQEIAIGEQAKPQLINEYEGELTTLRPYVSEVGNALVQHVEPQYKDLPWEFIALQSEQINAFALPGGKVFICKGLLVELSDEAELAAVLAHEIGHVTGQHVDERISHSMGVELAIDLLSTTTEYEFAVQAAQLFGTGYQLRFSRQQESESDELGLKYMVAAGYDPQGLIGVLEVLQSASQGSQNMEILSTHPHPETRLAQVHELLAGPYSYTVNNPDFVLYPARYETNVLQPLGK